MITSVLLSIVGTIGFTIEDSVDSIPTPNVPNSVFFADEPVQSNPLALLVSANADITWDRSDVFLVVADDDKKDQCDGLNFIERSNPNTELCTRNDNDFVAIYHIFIPLKKPCLNIFDNILLFPLKIVEPKVFF